MTKKDIKKIRDYINESNKKVAIGLLKKGLIDSFEIRNVISESDTISCEIRVNPKKGIKVFGYELNLLKS